MCRTTTGNEASRSFIDSHPDGHCARRVSVRHDSPRSRDIVQMSENEVEIAKLAAPLEVSHTATHQKSAMRGRAPSLDETSGHVVFRSEAGLDQTGRDPGTTQLILFSKLAV